MDFGVDDNMFIYNRNKGYGSPNQGTFEWMHPVTESARSRGISAVQQPAWANQIPQKQLPAPSSAVEPYAAASNLGSPLMSTQQGSVPPWRLWSNQGSGMASIATSLQNL